MADKISNILARQVHRIKTDDFYLSDEWRKLRYRVLLKYGSRCQCCGAKPPFVEIHVDHVKPVSKFPDLALDFDNLQVLCVDCNLGKSNIYTTDHRPRQHGDGMRYQELLKKDSEGTELTPDEKEFVRRYLHVSQRGK